MLIVETARFETPHGSKYLQQLCKHLAHKISVEYDDRKGSAALPTGPASLSADEAALLVEISAEDEAGLERARHIIDHHLKRFAFREAFDGMDWKRATAAT